MEAGKDDRQGVFWQVLFFPLEGGDTNEDHWLGRVKIAKHEVTGKIAAIKIVPKGVLCASRMSMNEAGARADKIMLGIEREIVIMKLIDHPNVLSLFDVWETKTEL